MRLREPDGRGELKRVAELGHDEPHRDDDQRRCRRDGHRRRDARQRDGRWSGTAAHVQPGVASGVAPTRERPAADAGGDERRAHGVSQPRQSADDREPSDQRSGRRQGQRGSQPRERGALQLRAEIEQRGHRTTSTITAATAMSPMATLRGPTSGEYGSGRCSLSASSSVRQPWIAQHADDPRDHDQRNAQRQALALRLGAQQLGDRQPGHERSQRGPCPRQEGPLVGQRETRVGLLADVQTPAHSLSKTSRPPNAIAATTPMPVTTVMTRAIAATVG